MFIADDLYGEIVKVIPVLCVDIIVEINSEFYLLKRNDEPLKNHFWVPGGRVMRCETLRAAACRKLHEECGIVAKEKELEIHGVYEDVFDKSAFGTHTYHTVSVVFRLTLSDPIKMKLDGTSTNWKLADKLPERLTTKLERVND